MTLLSISKETYLMIINSHKNHYPIYIFAILVGVFLTSCSFIVSGHFQLDKESPLPIWFKNDAAISRENISVKITSYEAYNYMPGKIKFKIYDSDGKKLADATGTWEWHPKSLKKIKEGSAGVPNWTIVKVKGTSEVYEQRERNDILKIVSGPIE